MNDNDNDPVTRDICNDIVVAINELVPDMASRIAEYLRINNFKNLKEAIEKGGGDTSPLTEKKPQTET